MWGSDVGVRCGVSDGAWRRPKVGWGRRPSHLRLVALGVAGDAQLLALAQLHHPRRGVDDERGVRREPRAFVGVFEREHPLKGGQVDRRHERLVDRLQMWGGCGVRRGGVGVYVGSDVGVWRGHTCSARKRTRSKCLCIRQAER